ncbi:MAG: hypothetical protein R3332_00395 [Pseudohongiellaceae bacterium]|nr:hypothetical protein [Pseudohongiellaceae bacterium]
MKITICIAMLLLLTACGSVSQNLDDGYQRGDIAQGLKEDRAWYCGSGMLGIRAVARFVLRGFGAPVPDICKVLDVVVENAE